jgi:hypothetical protein
MFTYKYLGFALSMFSLKYHTSKLQKHMPDENNLLIWQVEMNKQ